MTCRNVAWLVALIALSGCFRPPGATRGSTTGGSPGTSSAGSTTGSGQLGSSSGAGTSGGPSTSSTSGSTGACVCDTTHNWSQCGTGTIGGGTGSCRAGQQVYCSGSCCGYVCNWYDTPPSNRDCTFTQDGTPCPISSMAGTTGGPGTSASSTTGGSTGGCVCDQAFACSGSTVGGSTGGCHTGQQVYCAGDCCSYSCAWYDAPPPIHNPCTFPQDGTACPSPGSLQGDLAFPVAAAAYQPHASYDVELSLYEHAQTSTCPAAPDTRRLDIYAHHHGPPPGGTFPVADPDAGDYADIALVLDGGQAVLAASAGTLTLSQSGSAWQGSFSATFADAGSLQGTFEATFCTP